MSVDSVANEARSGLAPWALATLPEPPRPRGLEWVRVVGPGVIVLGLSIGSGEFLLGPAVFVRYGLSLLWITIVSIVLQVVFNLEVMRYTIATGEPVFTGFMRTRPSSTAWAVVYAILYLLQYGWPAFAGTAAGAMFFLYAGALPGPADASTIYYIGVGIFLTCVAVLSVGTRIVRTLEILNWVLVVTTLGGLLVLAIAFVPAGTWMRGVAGLVGFDLMNGRFDFFPEAADLSADLSAEARSAEVEARRAQVDLFLLAALVAYSGAGGVANIVLSNWARDKGYGMGERAGYIPAAVGGTKVHLAPTGFTFAPDADAMRRWRGWWHVVTVDQWGVFALGAALGMLLPALLYVTFLPAGADIQGLGISAALASGMMAQAGPAVGGAVAFLAAWILFKTQLDNFEGMTRAITDILWTGSRHVRSWRGGDVRTVYYGVMGILVVWGIIALGLAQPIMLLKISANVAGVVFVVASLHLLYINTQLLPEHIRPPLWRRAVLVAMALFYGFFVALSASSML